MKIKKFSSLVIVLLFCSMLFSSTDGEEIVWDKLMAELLADNSDFQQLLNRYKQEKAEARINSSLGLFDINVTYKAYENDIFRQEIDSDLEESDIIEEDKRWRIELSRQFFPKDFDATSDNISSKIDLFRYEQELLIARTECLSDALDDIIEWYEVDKMTEILHQKLKILMQENKLLEELLKENIIEVKQLIANLEDIEDLEKDIADLQELDNEYGSKYDNPIHKYHNMLFVPMFENYTIPDTILFLQKVGDNRTELIDEFQKIARKIKFNYFKLYMPEVNLSLSYNWRDTDQDWNIVEDGSFKTMSRSQNEEYPEGEIEFSLPFNIFSNSSGKLALLRSYRDELGYRFDELEFDWKTFLDNRLHACRTAQQKLIRKTRLKDLYGRYMTSTMNKFQTEPFLLGTNPELKLKKETLKTSEAELDFEIAKMKLHKEIYLINSFGEGSK